MTVAHPSQWRAMTDDGRPIFVHYKWGELRIWAGPIGSEDREVATDELLVDVDVDIGHRRECEIAWIAVIGATGIAMVDP